MIYIILLIYCKLLINFLSYNRFLIEHLIFKIIQLYLELI
jgi:hypothetical protein